MGDDEPEMIAQLRAALERGGSLYAIAEASGISRAALSRFVRGERGLSLESAARVCEVLGISLKIPARLRSEHDQS